MPYPSQLVRRIGAAPLTLAFVATLMTVSISSAAPTVVGYKDFSYTATSVNDPSQDKPQSKLWFTDGTWFGGLFSVANSAFDIYRLDLATQTWVDTGVAVDLRNNSHADYMWDEVSQKLYVASAHPTGLLQVNRLSYNATTNVYSQDAAGFPVTVGTGGSESLTIAKDSTNRLWVGFTQADPADPAGTRNVMINYTTSADQLTWAGAAVLPVQGPDKPTFDDIAAIIALGGDRIGIMWSSRRDVLGKTFFYWSERLDAAAATAWDTKKIAGSGNTPFAEDHINLKLATTDSGDVLAAVKTNSSTKNIQLLRYSGTGPWLAYGVFFDPGNQTRPQLVVDDEHDIVYVFASDNEGSGGGNIIYKSAPLTNLASISTAPIKTFIDGGPELANNVNNFSTTKQNVNSTTGILGIATSSTNYYHNYISLAGSGPVVTRIFGANRYATAALVSQRNVPTPGAGVAAVYIATGENFPDALGGVPAAGKRGASILLVQKNVIPAETQTELNRLNPAKIFLLGGTGVISTAVENSLATDFGTVTRLAGANRYATAAAVAVNDFNTAAEVIIATGEGFADALGGGAAGAHAGDPILLVQKNVLPPET
ncbi:MAG: cell wall-binding repeat-containing protein, partial [Chloroflexota bacterium]|nr:cell wall-binding repeat-containing protein [Chloroflexota bacterium]